MNKTRGISLIFIVFITLYSVLIQSSVDFRHHNKFSPCNLIILEALSPWDSGCVYKALFQKKSHAADVAYEKYKLDIFHKKNGMVPNVLWYHTYFSREFKEQFNYTSEEIDEHFWRYQQTKPNETDELAKYIKYQLNQKNTELAQLALDHFCKTYIKDYNGAIIVNSIYASLNNAELSINIDECLSLLHKRYRQITN